MDDKAPKGEPGPRGSATGEPLPVETAEAGASSPKAQQPSDEEDLEFENFFSTRKPKDFKAGLSSGMKSIGKGVLAGVAGLVVAPIAGARKEGVVGAAKGLASGVVGAVVLPTVGVCVGGYQMTRGAMNTPEAVRETAQGKSWDAEAREWIETPSDAVAIDDPVYADARARYQKTRAEANGKTFPYYYDVLGVNTTATEAEIKKAYYVKARQCHPDKKQDDELANEQFQQLGEAYQVISNPDLRARYDAKQDVSGDTDLMASGEFFAMLFGSMRFEEFVGELMISTLARYGGEVTREQVEKVQGLRTDTVRDNLLVYIDSLWRDSNDMFDMHMKNMAIEKLATAEYGPMMLTTLGKVYRLQAKRAQGNFAAYFKQQGSKIGSTWSALSTAMKVMQHQKAAEKNEDPVEAGESQKEQLRLMLDAMWATNALDIQNTVAKACSLALNDKACTKDELKQRAIALEHMGVIFLEVGNAALEASSGKDVEGHNQQDIAAQRIEKALQETLEKMDRDERGENYEPGSSSAPSSSTAPAT